MILQIVRFKSNLSDEGVFNMYEARAPRYRALKGLVQKYYVKFRATGEHGAVYVWASEADMQGFRESDLAKSIPSAYQVEGSPHVELADLSMALRTDG